MDVVFKEDVLYLQGVKFGKKTWRRNWMVLFQPSASGIGRFELYNVHKGSAYHQTKHPPQRQAERRVVRLCDCLSITPAPEESCPLGCTAFHLNTTKRTYTMASEACQDWMEALCLLAFQRDPSGPDSRSLQRGMMPLPMEDNELYSTCTTAQYRVTVQPTEASRRCGLVGDYLLSPETDSLLLLDIRSAQSIYCWPYHLLRRFGCVKGGFAIEAGRRCPSGEGQFTFQSQHIPQIHRAMEEAIALQHQEQHAKPPTWMPTASDCPQGNTGFLSDRLASPQQPSRNSPITSALTEPEPDSELYSTIYDDTLLNYTHQEPVPPRIQRRGLLESGLGWEGDEGEEGICLSLESFSLDEVKDEPYYHNLTTWIESQQASERDSPTLDCARNPQSPYQSHSQPQSLFTCNAMPPILATKSKPHLKTLSLPTSQPQTQGGGETCWKEQGSPTINPTDIPVNFKLKLTNILSKDLANLQRRLSNPGSDSPTVHHD